MGSIFSVLELHSKKEYCSSSNKEQEEKKIFNVELSLRCIQF